MLKCCSISVDIGCVNSCGAIILPILAPSTGEYSVNYIERGVAKQFIIFVEENKNVILPNNFAENSQITLYIEDSNCNRIGNCFTFYNQLAIGQQIDCIEQSSNILFDCYLSNNTTVPMDTSQYFIYGFTKIIINGVEYNYLIGNLPHTHGALAAATNLLNISGLINLFSYTDEISGITTIFAHTVSGEISNIILENENGTQYNFIIYQTQTTEPCY